MKSPIILAIALLLGCGSAATAQIAAPNDADPARPDNMRGVNTGRLADGVSGIGETTVTRPLPERSAASPPPIVAPARRRR